LGFGYNRQTHGCNLLTHIWGLSTV